MYLELAVLDHSHHFGMGHEKNDGRERGRGGGGISCKAKT